jgi:hypothetical protein
VQSRSEDLQRDVLYKLERTLSIGSTKVCSFDEILLFSGFVVHMVDKYIVKVMFRLYARIFWLIDCLNRA